MSRTDTAVRVISASPDRVFAALTDIQSRIAESDGRLRQLYIRVERMPLTTLEFGETLMPATGGWCGRHAVSQVPTSGRGVGLMIGGS
jgi:hypothetical protein